MLGILTATSVISASAPGVAVATAGSLNDVRANTSTTGAQNSASIARDADGDFVVVWAGAGNQVLQTDTAGVFFQLYDALGVAQGAETLVNTTTTGAQSNPAVAMDASGSFVVAWQDCGGATCEIQMQRFDNAGQAQGNETAVNTLTTDDQTFPTVAMAPTGVFVVAWQSLNQDGSGQGVYAQRFAADGTAAGTEFRVNTTTAFSQIDPAAAMDIDGDFVIVWTSGDGAGQGNGVFAQAYSANGTAAGTEFRANVTTAGEQVDPAVGMSAAGTFTIAWDGPGTGTDIFMRRYDVSRVAQTAGDETVNATTTGEQTDPAIALDTSGDIVIAWTGVDATLRGILFQRFNAAGAAQGSETPANNTTAGDQAFPAVAVDADGDFVVAWESDATDAFFRRFSGPEDVDLKITKAESVDPVTNGGPYTYTLTVLNQHAAGSGSGNATVDAGIGTATGITVTDVLPAGVAYVGGTGTGWTCANATGTVTCTYANVLAPAASSAVTLSVTAPVAGGAIDNTASVSGDQYDSATANDADTETTYACATPNAGTLQFSAATFTAGEADGNATITVTRGGGNSCGTASVQVAGSDGTATAGEDYTGFTPVTLSWNDGESGNKTFTIAITEEAAHEFDNESVSLALQNPDRATLGSQATATLNITDNDTPPVVTLAVTGSPFSENAGTATVTANLSKPAGRAVQVNLAYNAGAGANATGDANRGTGCGTATTPNDYACSATSISIAKGASSGNVTLTGVDDTRDENDLEPAVVTATCRLPASQGDEDCDDTATVQASPQVQDDDVVPTVQFSAASASVSEAQDPLNLPSQNRTATVTLQLSAASDRQVDVGYTSGGTATKGTDFTLSPDSPGNFAFTPSQTSKTITATVIHDTVDEPDETIVLTLGSPANATLGANNPETLTITDDEATPTVQFNPNTATNVVEASSNPLQVTATARLSVASSQTVTVPFTVSGTAANPEDHDAQAGTITITAGNTTGTYVYTVANDALDENDNETVVLTMGTPSAGATLGTNITHTADIDDDPADPLPVVKFETATSTASEAGGTASIIVLLTDGTNPKASGRTVTVPYTITGTASNGGDYALSPASPLSFAAGETSKTLTVTLINDPNNESNAETLIVTLGNPTNATINPSACNPANGTCRHTLTITDDDDVPQVHFAIDAQSAVEGDGSVLATVQLSRTTNVDVTVPFTTGGSAAANDYTLLCPDGLGGTQACAGEVVIAAGGTMADITIQIAADSRVEADETLTLTIGTPVNATKDEPSAHTLTIGNDDTAGVTVDPVTADVIEGGAGDNYTLVLDSQPSADVTIDLTVGADATVAPPSVTFTTADWDTPKPITVNAVNDALAEGPHGDTITHAASSVDLDYQGIAVDDVDVSVTDNDTPAIALTESGGSTRVTEGGATDSYTLVLTTQPTADVVITITPSSQVTRTPPTVTFTTVNWNTPQPVTITADNDTIAEGNHSGTVAHSVASTDGDYGGMALRTVNVPITDNDVAGVTVTQSGGTTEVTEGSATDTYTLVLTSQPSADVTIAISGDAEVSPDQASVTFTAVNWNLGRTITVAAVDDSAVEGDHAGAISHLVTSADPAYSGIAAAGFSVAVTDDDSVVAGDNASPVVVTVTGGTVNVAAPGGGGALPGSSLLGLLGLLALRRRRMAGLSLLLGLALIPGAANAQKPASTQKQAAVASKLSYRYADLRYISADAKDADVGASGFSLAGSWAVNPDVFLTGSYAQADTDDFTVQAATGSVKSSSLSFGGGLRRALANGTDGTIAASLVYAKAEGEGGFAGNTNDTGFALEAGLRGWMAPKVEWGAALNYLSIFDDSSTSLNAQGLYHFTPKVALVLGTGFSDSATQFNLGVRFNF